MTTSDLIVVGAGPAGSSAAIFASRLGMDVLILEKQKKGRDKYCGGGVSYGAGKLLEEKVSKEVSETIELKIGGAVVFSPSGRELILRFTEEVTKFGGLVRRSVFDTKLMEIAESEGAEFKGNKEVVRAKANANGIMVATRDGSEFKGRYLIIATGATDTLGEQLGIPPLKREAMGGCWGTEFKFNVKDLMEKWKKKWMNNPTFLFFGFVPSGYAWIFPKKEYLNIGIGTTIENFREHKERFLSFLKKAAECDILPNLEIEHDRAAMVPFGKVPRSKTYSKEGRTLLVGDAAGFVHPVTGDGIYGAVHGSLIAARVLKVALDKGDPSQLEKYRDAWWSEFGEDSFYYGGKIANLLYGSFFMMETGIKALMCDEETSRRLGHLLTHYTKDATKRMYERISGLNLLSLVFKSLKAPKRAEIIVDAGV